MNLFQSELVNTSRSSEPDEDMLFQYFEDLYADYDAYSLEDLLRIVQEDKRLDVENAATAPFSTDEEALLWALAHICESGLGRALACDARFEEWALEVDDVDGDRLVIDPQLRIVIIPRGTPSVMALARSLTARFEFLLNLARGLRLIWQDMNGVRSRIDLTADDQIFMERARRADQDIIALRMAWEMREEGLGQFWHHLISGSLGDLADSAASLWSSDSKHAPVSQRLPQIFLGWLASDLLLNEVDSRALDDMDARLQNSIHDVCGTSFLTPQDLMALGRMPEGGSYLAPLSRTILYVEDLRLMPDPINEAHLQQILEDSGTLLAPALVFQDSELERKFFPNRIIDTLA